MFWQFFEQWHVQRSCTELTNTIRQNWMEYCPTDFIQSGINKRLYTLNLSWTKHTKSRKMSFNQRFQLATRFKRFNFKVTKYFILYYFMLCLQYNCKKLFLNDKHKLSWNSGGVGHNRTPINQKRQNRTWTGTSIRAHRSQQVILINYEKIHQLWTKSNDYLISP